MRRVQKTTRILSRPIRRRNRLAARRFFGPSRYPRGLCGQAFRPSRGRRASASSRPRSRRALMCFRGVSTSSTTTWAASWWRSRRATKDLMKAGYGYRTDHPAATISKTSVMEGDVWYNTGTSLDGTQYPSTTVVDFYLGAIQVGDWFNFTVNVQTAGTYTLELDVVVGQRPAGWRGRRRLDGARGLRQRHESRDVDGRVPELR
jgi:hypothetical protein